jgi:hypothetical protein
MIYTRHTEIHVLPPGYSTSSATQHRRLLNIVNLVHNRNEETKSENPGLLDLTDY